MGEKSIAELRERTESKLRYANLHYEELRATGAGVGDFERAHVESFLFHLLGAREAFLRELTHYYSIAELDDVTMGNVRNKLVEMGKSTKETGELFLLEQDQNSWFSIAKTCRDYTTHDGPLLHHITMFAGSSEESLVELQKPDLPTRLDRNMLSVWYTNMVDLLDRLRRSAINSNKRMDNQR